MIYMPFKRVQFENCIDGVLHLSSSVYAPFSHFLSWPYCQAVCLCVPMQPQSISSCYRLYLLDCTAETSDGLRYLPSVGDLLIVFGDCFWLHWSETIFRSQLCTKHFSVSASALENTQPVSLLLLCVCVLPGICFMLLSFVSKEPQWCFCSEGCALF